MGDDRTAFVAKKVCLWLEHLRRVAQKKKWSSPAKYVVVELVIVHKSRWPRRRVENILSPWFGPFKNVQVSLNSIMVLTSPSLGGLAQVSFSQVKHWISVHEPNSFDSSTCAAENEESEDGPVSAQLAESSLVPSQSSETECAGEKHENAGDG